MVKADIIFQYFPNLSDIQKAKYSELYTIYLEWNNKINVISRKDMDNFYERHVLHSLGISIIKSFSSNDMVIDVGTGGGFPGVPLAIMFPNTQFILCDSIAKKITVVKEVCSHLQLDNINALVTRSEDLKMKADAIVSRAVSQLAPFYNMTKHLLKESHDGVHYLKGGEINEEIKTFKSIHKKMKVKQMALSGYFKSPFFDTKKVVSLINSRK